ncbi:hypothetical protein [Actinomadura decatromicini]|nr:hypothetical protein [Actinomadura decatromicini]
MTYLSVLLGLVAVAMMLTLALQAVRRDRELRRDAPENAVSGEPAGR